MSLEDVFEENDGGVDNEKAIIHDKRWDVCMNAEITLLGVDIMWECQVLTGRRFFGKR